MMKEWKSNIQSTEWMSLSAVTWGFLVMINAEHALIRLIRTYKEDPQGSSDLSESIQSRWSAALTLYL